MENQEFTFKGKDYQWFPDAYLKYNNCCGMHSRYHLWCQYE